MYIYLCVRTCVCHCVCAFMQVHLCRYKGRCLLFSSAALHISFAIRSFIELGACQQARSVAYQVPGILPQPSLQHQHIPVTQPAALLLFMWAWQIKLTPSYLCTKLFVYQQSIEPSSQPYLYISFSTLHFKLNAFIYIHLYKSHRHTHTHNQIALQYKEEQKNIENQKNCV